MYILMLLFHLNFTHFVPWSHFVFVHQSQTNPQPKQEVSDNLKFGGPLEFIEFTV